jgi:hypothetical protein
MAEIESRNALWTYLASASPENRLTPIEIDVIVNSAMFENGKFRGMFLGALSTKFNQSEIIRLQAALGDPQVHSDCYPAADRCVPRDNCWCAH